MTNENSFLPSDYSVPKSTGRYTKFEQGKNKIRILSKPIIGYIAWGNDNKPHRFRMDEEVKGDFRDPAKHFWAFIIYNYETLAIEILEITQKGIMQSIEELLNDDAWGSPFEYDLMINRKGQSMETKYTVVPQPKIELDPNVKAEYEKQNINLEALYDDGANPFEE